MTDSPSPPQNASQESSRDNAPLTVDLRNWALVGLFILAAGYTFYIAKPVLLPIILAILLYFLIRPIHEFLTVRLHIPRVVGAALTLVLLVGSTSLGLVYLTEPAADWMGRLPMKIEQMKYKVRGLIEPVEQVQKVAQQVDEMVSSGDEGGGQVAVSREKMSEKVFTAAGTTVSYVSISFILLFFLLGYSEHISVKLSRRNPSIPVMREVSRIISSYLFTVTVINMGLGVCIAVAMWALDMPNPILWGVMAWLLNYIPYFGAITGVGIVAFVAFLTFDSTAHIAAVPIVYFCLTAAEGNFVTPMVLGRQFTLNPIFIFIALVFFGWIWGVAGSLIAVPLLMTIKIVCDSNRLLEPLGQVLSL